MTLLLQIPYVQLAVQHLVIEINSIKEGISDSPSFSSPIRPFIAILDLRLKALSLGGRQSTKWH